MTPTRTATATSALFVAVGGFAGATTRYGVDLAVLLVLSGESAAMAATLLVNILGSFALGSLFFGGLFGGRRPLLDERLTLVLATGFISSFTTYSTFVLDAVLANPPTAMGYVVASYIFGLGAAMVGRWGSRRLGSQSERAGDAP